MANREALSIIRAARAGEAAAQLALGKLYLSGRAGLPLSLSTALHWLERAAQQGSAEACELIGVHTGCRRRLPPTTYSTPPGKPGIAMPTCRAPQCRAPSGRPRPRRRCCRAARACAPTASRRTSSAEGGAGRLRPGWRGTAQGRAAPVRAGVHRDRRAAGPSRPGRQPSLAGRAPRAGRHVQPDARRSLAARCQAGRSRPLPGS